jgi:hypothetical protein
MTSLAGDSPPDKRETQGVGCEESDRVLSPPGLSSERRLTAKISSLRPGDTLWYRWQESADRPRTYTA